MTVRRPNIILPQFGERYDGQKMRRLVEEVERILLPLSQASAETSTSVEWADILNKPACFVPCAHVHTFLGLIDTPGVYLGAGGKFVRVRGDEAGLEYADPSVAGVVAWGDITGKPETATRWPAWTEVTAKPTSFPPSSHTHPIEEITGFPPQDFDGGNAFTVYVIYLWDFDQGGAS